MHLGSRDVNLISISLAALLTPLSWGRPTMPLTVPASHVILENDEPAAVSPPPARPYRITSGVTVRCRLLKVCLCVCVSGTSVD